MNHPKTIENSKIGELCTHLWVRFYMLTQSLKLFICPKLNKNDLINKIHKNAEVSPILRIFT